MEYSSGCHIVKSLRGWEGLYLRPDIMPYAYKRPPMFGGLSRVMKPCYGSLSQ